MSIVPLSEWYPAMAAKWDGDPVPHADREAWIHHHTAGGQGSDPLAYARGVADYHWKKWGVPGGYGVLIGTDGVAREMSGLDFEGVHSGTHYWNHYGIGIAYQGDFRYSPPTEAMLDTAREVIADFPLPQTYHRAVRPTYTDCPGDALIRLLPLEVDDMPTAREIWDTPAQPGSQEAGFVLLDSRFKAGQALAVAKSILKAVNQIDQIDSQALAQDIAAELQAEGVAQGDIDELLDAMADRLAD